MEKLVIHVAAQITIGDDALQMIVVIDNAETAKVFLRHCDEGIFHGGVLGDEGALVGGMHDIRHMKQICTQFAARMDMSKVFLGKSLALQKCESDGIAQCQHDGGRCGGGKSKRTRFLKRWQCKQIITCAG